MGNGYSFASAPTPDSPEIKYPRSTFFGKTLEGGMFQFDVTGWVGAKNRVGPLAFESMYTT